MVTSRSVELRLAGSKPRSAHVGIPEDGAGPGLLLLHESPQARAGLAKLFAEEGYVVLAPDITALTMPQLLACAAELRARPEHAGSTGVLGFGAGGGLALAAAREPVFAACVAYYPESNGNWADAVNSLRCPTTIHLAGDAAGAVGQAFSAGADVRVFAYPTARPGFHDRDRPEYDRPAARASHTRTLERLRGILGPHYDLAALWDAHIMHEFLTRSADETIATMV